MANISRLHFLLNFNSRSHTHLHKYFENILQATDYFLALYIDVPYRRPPWWRIGSGLDCGLEDSGSIPGIPSPPVGPLMARRLRTSSDVLVPVSG